MAKAYYPTGNGSYTEWTPDMVGALGSSFSNMLYKTYDGETDWNVLDSGIYYIRCGTFSNELHQPVGAYSYGVLLCFTDNSYFNNITQIYIGHSNNNLWYRQRWQDSNNFTDWNCMVTNINIGAQSVNYANSSNYANYCNNERSVVISSTRPTDDKCKIWVKI